MEVKTKIKIKILVQLILPIMLTLLLVSQCVCLVFAIVDDNPFGVTGYINAIAGFSWITILSWSYRLSNIKRIAQGYYQRKETTENKRIRNKRGK